MDNLTYLDDIIDLDDPRNENENQHYQTREPMQFNNNVQRYDPNIMRMQEQPSIQHYSPPPSQQYSSPPRQQYSSPPRQQYTQSNLDANNTFAQQYIHTDEFHYQDVDATSLTNNYDELCYICEKINNSNNMMFHYIYIVIIIMLFMTILMMYKKILRI